MKLATGSSKLIPSLLVIGFMFYVITEPAKAAEAVKKAAAGLAVVIESLTTFLSNIT